MAEELREKEWEAYSHMVFAVRQEGRLLSFSIFVSSKTLAHGIALPTVGLGLPSLEIPSPTHKKVVSWWVSILSRWLSENISQWLSSHSPTTAENCPHFPNRTPTLEFVHYSSLALLSSFSPGKTVVFVLSFLSTLFLLPPLDAQIFMGCIGSMQVLLCNSFHWCIEYGMQEGEACIHSIDFKIHPFIFSFFD